jgi:tRNA (adenine57-N1/adenine58-N1)-methyltransferase
MKGFVYILRPSSHLYTTSLSQRTQILYTPDISQVLLRLELKSGMRVVESGTGSGSLSTSITRAILPDGHLFTYEFNQVRSEKAREDFKRLGFGNAVTVTHRDVLSNGFILKDESNDITLVGEGSIDAVFLDLPRP